MNSYNILGVECITSNKLFDFGADPDHDPDPGFVQRNFLSLRYRAGCKNFAGLAAALAPFVCLWFAGSNGARYVVLARLQKHQHRRLQMSFLLSIGGGVVSIRI